MYKRSFLIQVVIQFEIVLLELLQCGLEFVFINLSDLSQKKWERITHFFLDTTIHTETCKRPLFQI